MRHQKKTVRFPRFPLNRKKGENDHTLPVRWLYLHPTFDIPLLVFCLGSREYDKISVQNKAVVLLQTYPLRQLTQMEFKFILKNNANPSAVVVRLLNKNERLLHLFVWRFRHLYRKSM